jgi:hypothetical protein
MKRNKTTTQFPKRLIKDGEGNGNMNIMLPAGAVLTYLSVLWLHFHVNWHKPVENILLACRQVEKPVKKFQQAHLKLCIAILQMNILHSACTSRIHCVLDCQQTNKLRIACTRIIQCVLHCSGLSYCVLHSPISITHRMPR